MARTITATKTRILFGDKQACQFMLLSSFSTSFIAVTACSDCGDFVLSHTNEKTLEMGF